MSFTPSVAKEEPASSECHKSGNIQMQRAEEKSTVTTCLSLDTPDTSLHANYAMTQPH